MSQPRNLSSNIFKVVVINFCQRFHLYIHAYALLLQSRGLSLLEITTIESVVIGSIFLMEVPTGVIADRIGRKWSIAASTFFMMSAELLFFFANSYPVYIVVGFLTGVGFAFASGAVDAMVYDSLPASSPDSRNDRENLMKLAMGRVGSMGQIAFFISPIIGALIIGDASPENFRLAMLLTIVALFIGLLVSFTLREPAREPERESTHDTDTEKTSSFEIFRSGLAEIRDNTNLQRLMILIIFTMPFTGTLVTTFAAPYLTQRDVSPFMIGMALSLGSLLGAVTTRYAYKLEAWLGQRSTILLLILMPGIMYWILALVVTPMMAFGVVVFMYATNDMKSPLFSAYQNAQIQSKNRATVLSMINMCTSLFVALVAPLYAAVASHSMPLAFMLMGGVIFIAGITLYGRREIIQPAT